MCSIHVNEPATIQCIGCLKAKLPPNRSYHCTPQCYKAAWARHRSWHCRGLGDTKEGGEDGSVAEEGKSNSINGPASDGLPPSGVSGTFGSGGGYATNNGWMGRVAGGPRGRSTPPPPHPELNSEGSVGSNNSSSSSSDSWLEVGRGRSYTPSTDDVGHVLKLECTPVENASGNAVAAPSTILTSRVIPAPSPTPRRMVPIADGPSDNPAMGGNSGGSGSGGTFSLLTYNVLADLFATSEMYSYCPPWALSWAYRRQNLLKELLGYKADIMCLQEVSMGLYCNPSYATVPTVLRSSLAQHSSQKSTVNHAVESSVCLSPGWSHNGFDGHCTW